MSNTLATNLKILGLVAGTLGLYTLVANSIPQVESEVPEELTFSGEVTAAELVEAGQRLFEGAGGCTACHGLGERAPNLRAADATGQTIGARCGTRVPGQDCKTYLYQSMVAPTEFVAEGFDPIMPDMTILLDQTQIWAVVAYMQDLGGEVTVTGDDIAASDPGGGDPAGSAPAAGGGPAVAAPGGTDPVALLQNNLCLSCHQLEGQGVALGPPLDGIGALRDADYLRRSILDPNAEVAEGFEAFAGTMPPNFGQLFTAGQLEILVQYLAGLQ